MTILERKKYNKIKGVYAIKSIIGSTINLYNRCIHHYDALVGKYHYNFKLQRFHNKYGINNLEFEIIEECEDNSELLIKEQFYLNLYNSYKKGFNIVPIVESTTLGYKHTNETKKKIGEKSKNRIFSEKSKLKMSQKAIGVHCGENNYTGSKLKTNDVILIKKLLNSNFELGEISKLFNVNFRTIWNIKSNIRWKHIIINEILNVDEKKYYENIFYNSRNIRKNEILNKKKVKHIKYLIINDFIKTNDDKKRITDFFCISKSHLNNIIRGVNWKNIEPEFISEYNLLK